MEQNYSTENLRVISIHAEKCGHQACPHRSVCYHCNNIKQDNFFNLGLHDRITMLKHKNIAIHESICSKINPMNWHLLKFYKNYNITIPASLYKPYLDRVCDQVQITVYNNEQAIIFQDFQKLFLIKDNRTLDTFISMSTSKNKDIKKIHYVFDQKYITKDILNHIVAYNNIIESSEITIDNCFRSFMLNGRCPHSYSNYIDISSDGSIRTCPYTIEGILIPEDNLKDMINNNIDNLFTTFKPLCVQCKYKMLLDGELNE